MSFTKLTKIHHYTDIVCVGISTSIEPYQFSDTTRLINLHGFHTIHLRPKDGTLRKIDDIITWDTTDLFSCICNYLPTKHNPLIVINSSVVAIGSSDFVDMLDRREIIICQSSRDNEEFGYEEIGKQSTECFIASCPPTILIFQHVQSGRKFTLVDIANYGIDYISDVFDNLDNEDKSLVHNESELGVSEDNSLTCAGLIARFMQELYRVVADNRLGGLGLTYSSQSMRCFRNRFYKENIVTHTDRNATMIERGCYTGGRVEERYHGHFSGKVYLLDVQSLYPSIGRKKPFPTELLGTEVTPTRSTIDERLKTEIIGAYCHIQTDLPIYPVKIDNVLRFPTGNFNTFLIGEEFSEAWNTGCIKHIYNCNYYKSDYILSEYSQFMLDLRTKYKGANNRLAEYIVKLITNGLWGKFGQTGKCWIIDEREIVDRAYGGYYKHNLNGEGGIQYRVIDWIASRLEEAQFPNNSFTPISACMNGYSRFLMWQYMQLAGLDNVLYVCVDGLIVNQAGFDRLEWGIARTPYDYGKFKVAESGDCCDIYGYGKYAIGNKIAYMGCPRKDAKQYSGFWSVLDYVREPVKQTVLDGDTVLTKYKYRNRKEMLESSKSNTGYFMGKDTLDIPIDLRIDLTQQCQSSLFHEPEWLR